MIILRCQYIWSIGWLHRKWSILTIWRRGCQSIWLIGRESVDLKIPVGFPSPPLRSLSWLECIQCMLITVLVVIYIIIIIITIITLFLESDISVVIIAISYLYFSSASPSSYLPQGVVCMWGCQSDNLDVNHVLATVIHANEWRQMVITKQAIVYNWKVIV